MGVGHGIPLRALAVATGDLLVASEGQADVLVEGLAYDERPVRRGDLFFCVPGSVDGHLFARQAVEAGAAALCVERPTGAGVPELVVSDARRAMARICAEFYGRPSDAIALFGVTGTNGKTTTSFVLDEILKAAGRRTGVIGTMGAWKIGERYTDVRSSPITPPTLHRLLGDMYAIGVQSVTMEVTSHALALHRLEGLRFAAACFTNLSRDHLDFHENLDAYVATKRSLFVPDRLERGAVNVDEPYGRKLLEAADVPCLAFGCSPDAHVRAVEVRLGDAGSRFVIAASGPGIPSGKVEVSTPLAGAFNVDNCLAAAAVALAAGVGFEAVEAGIAAAPSIPGRFERIEAGQPFSVVVDYAHTPAALEAVLDEARRRAHVRGGRLICVFGCGGDTDRGKRPLMGGVAGRLADVAIVTSDNPRSEQPSAVIDEILAGVRKEDRGIAEGVVDRRDAIAAALAQARAGDVVLIAGRGHETTQIVNGKNLPFDDREVARQGLSALEGVLNPGRAGC
jgi:UDP-N-acetylmuramoyl-L-alanyl-D-glutamate--2,6-diaminopimelate ligase